MQRDAIKTLSKLACLTLCISWTTSTLAEQYPPQIQGYNPGIGPMQQYPGPQRPMYPQQRPPQFNPAMRPNYGYQGPAPYGPGYRPNFGPGPGYGPPPGYNNGPWNRMMPWGSNRSFGPFGNRGGKFGPFNRGPSSWFTGNPKDGLANMWDDMLEAPSEMGTMPGGWRAPSVSVPNPVDVGDQFGEAGSEFSREIPNFVQEIPDMFHYGN